MTRLLHLTVLSVVASLASAAPRSVAPWCIPRGGADAPVVSSATSIPAGGSDSGSYGSRLESVKSQILAAASDSVSELNSSE
jgi:hypothetical protein